MREQTESQPRGDPRASLISIVVLIVGQVFAVGWWASAINAKLDTAASKISELQATQYTRNEAAVNFRNVELQVIEVSRRVNVLEEHRASR